MSDILIRAGAFVAIILLGFLLKRIGLFKESEFGVLSKLLMKVTFEMCDRQLLLSVYKLDGESCVVEFDNRNNILVSLEKINGIIDDLKSISAS